MTIVLKHLFNLMYLLHSETNTTAISVGLCCGIVLGFSPLFSLQSLLIVLVILLFRVQIGAALLSTALFKIIGIPLVPLFDFVGNGVLSFGMLQPVFRWLYNLPVVPMTRFYNTTVMGAGVIAFLLVIPAYFLFEYLVSRYRSEVVERIKDTTLWTVWKTSKLFKWYQYYQSTYGRLS